MSNLKSKAKQPYFECNFDGLIGPSHNYAGIADGNLASQQHKYQPSSPKKAALQGLHKMQLLAELGVPQAFLPPLLRPHLAFCQSLGFDIQQQNQLTQFAQQWPELLTAIWSASSMWTANAATYTPQLDSQDQLSHFTPANLFTNFHRQLETTQRAEQLAQIFSRDNGFVHHAPLPNHALFADEGAANHSRLCQTHNHAGMGVFAYGSDDEQPHNHSLQVIPRQHRNASAAIINQHRCRQFALLPTLPRAMNAGVFHNDVIMVANQQTILLHEAAYIDQIAHLQRLQSQFDGDLTLAVVSEAELSLAQAVSCYLFNSQLLTLPGAQQLLLAPIECQTLPNAQKVIQKWLTQDIIQQVQFIDLSQSMHNGGGPACLRLRVVLSAEQMSNINPKLWITQETVKWLTDWIEHYYPDSLMLDDLRDSQLVQQCIAADAALQAYLWH